MTVYTVLYHSKQSLKTISSGFRRLWLNLFTIIYHFIVKIVSILINNENKYIN